MLIKKTAFCIIFLVFYGLQAQKETIVIEIQPYLQHMEPHAITVMWQTNKGEESVVEYGLTSKLGNKTYGNAFDINFTDVRVHKVRLEGLKRFTTYYYRVRTGKAKSDIFQFKTAPFVEDQENFSILAMSDMQFDNQEPEKFNEIVNQGILPYLKKSKGKELQDNLAMVLIPGDLVENGTSFHQWKNHFFNPAQRLFSTVPIYTVPGNHERNSDFYFKYFDLPKNGNPEYSEHWWYKDYGNTRIIGLDSNEGYRDLPSQINWLKKLLKETAENNKIDFVFAQLHHPHKSELWIPGEEKFSSKIVAMLEQFTETSSKPSIHFFGHTHGYSRGQSKNHKHLMVNVASAGGAIDNWGEFGGKDYDEFTKTEDEYGFVIVEVDGNRKNPKFTLKRISRGNTVKFRDNELSDSIVVYKNGVFPVIPKPKFPQDKTVDFKGFYLKATEFSSKMPKAFHAASQWQISTTTDFKKPVFDRWKQFENWYYKVDRQKNDDLTDEKIHRLKPNTAYFWRVRYRDQFLNWSPWSTTATFKTSSEKENGN